MNIKREHHPKQMLVNLSDLHVQVQAAQIDTGGTLPLLTGAPLTSLTPSDIIERRIREEKRARNEIMRREKLNKERERKRAERIEQHTKNDHEREEPGK